MDGLRPPWVVATLLGAWWTLAVGGYFVVFWSGAGQTPAMRLMRMRVVGREEAPPSFGRAALRFLGLLLAIAPLFAGLLPILVDGRRRGLHDYLGRTVVIFTDRPTPAEAERFGAAVANITQLG